jgi:hypothetical protein
MVLPSSKVNFAGHIPNREKLTLQRYLMKYLVKAPFPVREIGIKRSDERYFGEYEVFKA